MTHPPIFQIQFEFLHLHDKNVRLICGDTRLDRIGNVVIKEKVEVAPIEKKMREIKMR